MNMMCSMKFHVWQKVFCLVLMIWSFFLNTGCTPVISKELRKQVSEDLTLSMVEKDPEAYKGRIVLWSGEIICSVNKEEGTLMEILQKPADIQGKPLDVDYSEGRFLALSPDYLDVAIYKKGRKVTVAGEIKGKKTQSLGEIEYTYSLILAREIYLWPEERKERGYHTYPHPYYWYYPWGYYPYWYPW